MPLLTNYTEEASGPDSGLIHKLLNSSNDVKTKFINDLVSQVKKNHFSGINIDFEAVPESDRKLNKFYEKNLLRNFMNMICSLHKMFQLMIRLLIIVR